MHSPFIIKNGSPLLPLDIQVDFFPVVSKSPHHTRQAKSVKGKKKCTPKVPFRQVVENWTYKTFAWLYPLPPLKWGSSGLKNPPLRGEGGCKHFLGFFLNVHHQSTVSTILSRTPFYSSIVTMKVSVKFFLIAKRDDLTEIRPTRIFLLTSPYLSVNLRGEIQRMIVSST